MKFNPPVTMTFTVLIVSVLLGISTCFEYNEEEPHFLGRAGEPEIGRIPEFDKLLKKYASDIFQETKKRDMDHVVVEAIVLSKKGVGEPQLAKYYVKLLETMSVKGPAYLKEEMDTNTKELMSPSMQEIEGGKLYDLALKRRAILNAFSEAAAMHAMGIINDDPLAHFNIRDFDNIEVDLEKGGKFKKENIKFEYKEPMDKKKANRDEM